MLLFKKIIYFRNKNKYSLNQNSNLFEWSKKKDKSSWRNHKRKCQHNKVFLVFRKTTFMCA